MSIFKWWDLGRDQFYQSQEAAHRPEVYRRQFYKQGVFMSGCPGGREEEEEERPHAPCERCYLAVPPRLRDDTDIVAMVEALKEACKRYRREARLLQEMMTSNRGNVFGSYASEE